MTITRTTLLPKLTLILLLAAATCLAWARLSWADEAGPDDRVARVSAEMTRRIDRLDADCDFNAPFALTYLVTTDNVLRAVNQRVFANADSVARLDERFAQLYFDAFDAYRRGERARVPGPWRRAFDAAAGGRDSVLQDTLLGMNAHINYDLAIALAARGDDLDSPEAKRDFERVNDVLVTTTPELMRGLAERYDPAIGLATLLGRRFDAAFVQGVIAQWREKAWRNAVRLRDAAPANREAVRAEIEADATRIADTLVAAHLPFAKELRLTYAGCLR